MCRYLDILGSKVGIFPLCVGIGLFFYVMLILHTMKKAGVDEQTENSILCPLPFALTFGVFTAWFSDIINRGMLISFLKNPMAFGITYYGFLLGMIGFAILYGRIFRIDMFYLLNLWIPPLALAQACGRIGCFFAGCCYGIPCSSFFSVVYPEKSVPFQKYGITPLIPIQLVDALYLFILTIILFRMKIHKRFIWYLLCVSLGRFFSEFLRGDNRGQILGCTILSPAQLISVIFFIIGIILFFYIKTKSDSKNSMV